jgi:hypothetical protein
MSVSYIHCQFSRAFPGSATLQCGFWSRAGARRSQGRALVQDLRNGHLEPQPLFPRKHPIDPAFFGGMRRIQGRKSLCQAPEARVSPNAFLNEKPFQRFAATGGKQNHALVDAVEDGLALALDYRLAGRRFRSVRLFQDFEQVELRGLPLFIRRDMAFVFAKQVAGAFPYWQQSGLVP